VCLDGLDEVWKEGLHHWAKKLYAEFEVAKQFSLVVTSVNKSALKPFMLYERMLDTA